MWTLYRKTNGDEIIYDHTDGDLTYAFIRRKGKDYPPQIIDQLLARGYWEIVSDLKKEFNEDQPRDNHGRWTSGGIGSDMSPEERAERLASSEYIVGGGVLMTQEEKEAFLIDKFNSHPSTHYFDIKTAEDLHKMLKTWLDNAQWDRTGVGRAKADLRMFEKGLVWKNGETVVYMTDPRYGKDGGIQAIASNLDRLQEAAPIERLDVFAGYTAGTNLASATVGAENNIASGDTPVMYLKAGNLRDYDETTESRFPVETQYRERVGDSQVRTEVGQGHQWWTPAQFGETKALDSIMSHEWGHLMTRNGDDPAGSWYVMQGAVESIRDNNPAISGYSFKSWREYVAESFAEWHLSGGETKVEGARQVAELMKWK